MAPLTVAVSRHPVREGSEQAAPRVMSGVEAYHRVMPALPVLLRIPRCPVTPGLREVFLRFSGSQPVQPKRFSFYRQLRHNRSMPGKTDRPAGCRYYFVFYCVPSALTSRPDNSVIRFAFQTGNTTVVTDGRWCCLFQPAIRLWPLHRIRLDISPCLALRIILAGFLAQGGVIDSGR